MISTALRRARLDWSARGAPHFSNTWTFASATCAIHSTVRAQKSIHKAYKVFEYHCITLCYPPPPRGCLATEPHHRQIALLLRACVFVTIVYARAKRMCLFFCLTNLGTTGSRPFSAANSRPLIVATRARAGNFDVICLMCVCEHCHGTLLNEFYAKIGGWKSKQQQLHHQQQQQPRRFCCATFECAHICACVFASVIRVRVQITRQMCRLIAPPDHR